MSNVDFVAEAEVVEQADTPDLGSGALGRAGSSPAFRTYVTGYSTTAK